MSEHQNVTTLVKPVILYDDSDERCKPEENIAQVQPHKRLVQRFASVLSLFTMLAIVGVGGMVVLVSLLMGYPKKLKRLPDARHGVARHQKPPPGKPDIATLPGRYGGSVVRESSQGPAAAIDHHGNLDSPSWLSNRLCG